MQIDANCKCKDERLLYPAIVVGNELEMGANWSSTVGPFSST
jgi:hypothetical protein